MSTDSVPFDQGLTRPGSPEKQRVLIVCTGNSCRSQLAEALWRTHWGEEWEVHSAGSDPTGSVHPAVLEVLAEGQIDSTSLRSDPIDRYLDAHFDLVITVCDDAKNQCPHLRSTQTLHWPFPDPAAFADDAANSESLSVFRAARDAIESRILRFQKAQVDAKTLSDWFLQSLAQLPGEISEERASAFRSLSAVIAAELAIEGEVWNQIPQWIAERFESFGWDWNGFYLLRGHTPHRRLQLAAAAGPPVCATIEEQPGGIGSSGMCFDAVYAGVPLAAQDVKSWSGYVSCDGESGLETVSGLVVPIRRGGTASRQDVLAVWDLDSTQPLEPADPLLMGSLLQQLSTMVPLPRGQWGEE